MPLIRRILPYVATVLITVLAIYLTPLKWLNLIDPTINDIDPTEFNTDFQKSPEKYDFIDVRPEEAFKNAHAVGSRNVPLHLLYDERHVLPKKGKTIVLICSGGRASGVGYGYLEHFGFLNLRRIQGGIENWMIQGLPVEGTSVVATKQRSLASLANAGCPV